MKNKAAQSKVRKKKSKKIQINEHWEKINPDAAGIDIGAREIYVCVPSDRDPQPVRRFGTTTPELEKMADWLQECGIQTVAMEATGVYWIATFQILEKKGFQVVLVNHAKSKMSAAKRELAASFRPADAYCVTRSYLRLRDDLVAARGAQIQKMQKALHQMNVLLNHVITDISGESGLAIIQAILAGQRNPLELAKLANKRVKATREQIARALVGDYRAEHLFALQTAYDLYEAIEAKSAQCECRIVDGLYMSGGKVTSHRDDHHKLQPNPKPTTLGSLMTQRLAAILFWGCLLPAVLAAGTRWPQFRGPNSSGVSDSDKPPVMFGPGTNQIFKVQVPPGLSSPCIWGDRVFLSALEDGKLVTICYSAKDGKRLWSQAAPFEKLESYHQEGSPAASTPATDGERVYSYFGSGGVFAYTLDGKKVWEHKLPTAEHVGDFGTGTSPVVHDGLVMVNRDMLKNSHLLALRASDGEAAWRAERPEFNSGWSTPVVREADGGAKEVLLAGAQQLKAYDLKTGAEKWKFHGLPNAACPTPVVGDALVFFAGWSPTSQDVQLGRFAAVAEKNDKNRDGVISKDEATSGALPFLFKIFDKNEDGKLEREEWDKTLDEMNRAVNQAFALRPGKAGKGALSDDQVAWKYSRGLPYVPSSLLYRGNFYFVRDGGMVTCLDAATGKPHYEQERLGALGTYYPSPVAADGRIYICSNDGKLTVLSAGDKPEVLSRAELGERCVTTPAIANNKLFIRSAKHLWCFGE